jgi:anti-sigma B factor antagonist
MTLERTFGFELGADLIRGVRVVAVSGEIDLSRKSAVASALESDGVPLLVDLSAVTFMDSSGLAALVAARDDGNGAAPRLALVCPPGSCVRRLLDLTGVEGLFAVYPSRQDALEALTAG